MPNSCMKYILCIYNNSVIALGASWFRFFSNLVWPYPHLPIIEVVADVVV